MKITKLFTIFRRGVLQYAPTILIFLFPLTIFAQSLGVNDAFRFRGDTILDRFATTPVIAVDDCTSRVTIDSQDSRTVRIQNIRTALLPSGMTGRTDQKYKICFSFSGGQRLPISATDMTAGPFEITTPNIDGLELEVSGLKSEKASVDGFVGVPIKIKAAR